MGLGGLTIMSDDEALAVRGLGFRSGGSSAQASGDSFATINTPMGLAHSENGFNASGKHEASGDDFSFAGTEIMTAVDRSGHGERGGDFGGEPGKDPGHRHACNIPRQATAVKVLRHATDKAAAIAVARATAMEVAGWDVRLLPRHSQPSPASRTPRPTKILISPTGGGNRGMLHGPITAAAGKRCGAAPFGERPMPRQPRFP